MCSCLFGKGLCVIINISCGNIRLTATLEDNHDVGGITVNLFKIKRDDVTVKLEGLGNDFVHLTLGQMWSIPSNPVEIM